MGGWDQDLTRSVNRYYVIALHAGDYGRVKVTPEDLQQLGHTLSGRAITIDHYQYLDSKPKTPFAGYCRILRIGV